MESKNKTRVHPTVTVPFIIRPHPLQPLGSDQHPKPPNLPKQTTRHGSPGLWILLMADNSVADGMVPSASSTTLSFDEEHA
ncbi:hypothetical protein Q7P36_003455 [Cladosporium allicinum]